ncbi:MAG: 4Fe-4S double cluster binding domain-containing protein [Candidatus Thorarchaeota archaeon]
MTKNDDIIDKFYKTLALKGYKGRIVHAKRISDLRNDIKIRREQNLIYPPLYEEYKTYFEFKPNVKFSQINSLFIIAVPVPQFKAIFHVNQREYPTLIPPTYLYGLSITNELQDLLSDILNPEGYNVAYAQLPQKTLAVRCGLAEYGRNNITYVPEMGSFHRLTSFYSDFPTEHDNWQELTMMDLCKECSACVRKCPTGAIPTDRFLLRAGRCLTYHNEQQGDIPFPEWIDPKWHNCLVGCLHCQKVCPANKKVRDWTKLGPEFNEEETNLLLNEQNIEDLPKGIKQKLIEFDFENYLEVFHRNFSALLRTN